MSSLYPTGIRHCVRNGDTEVLAISVLAKIVAKIPRERRGSSL